MGVYIPNWKMPIHCSVCKFFDHGDCELLPYGDYIDDNHKRRDNCPLIEVPPHGDLIDKGKLGMTDFEITTCVLGKGNPYKNGLEYLLKKIEDAPVVIEAEVTK